MRQPRRWSGWWIGAATAVVVVIAILVLSSLLQKTAVTTLASYGKKRTTVDGIGPLRSIDMVSDTDGWAVTTTNKILTTMDGGQKWTDVTPKGMPRNLGPGTVGEDFTDATHAWVAVDAGNGQSPTLLYRTTDRGHTWVKGTTLSAYGVQFDMLSNATGFMLLHEGEGMGSEGVMLLGTTDGGTTWKLVANGEPTAQNPPVISGGDKSGLGFISVQDGWLTGSQLGNTVLLFATHDGGETWQPQYVSVPSGLTAENGSGESLPPSFFGTLDGVMPVKLMSLPGQQVMVFYRTTDGGQNWTPTKPVNPSGSLIYSVVDATHIIATDGSTLYQTSTGGMRWKSTPVNLQGVTFLDFTSPMAGWAVVGGSLMSSRDGGVTWHKVK